MVGRVYARWLKTILPTLFVLGLIASGFVIYKVNNEVGEELRMILNPHSANYQLEYGEQATANFTLQTNNYLFCEAVCRYNTSVDGVLLTSGEFVMHDSTENLHINIEAPTMGLGRKLYELDVGCQNIPTRTCRRDTRVHRSAALVSLEYGPSTQILQERATLLPAFEEYLLDLHDADINVQEILYHLTTIDETSLDGLYEMAFAVINEQTSALEEAQVAQVAWTKGEVPQFVQHNLLMKSSSALDSLKSYVFKQNELALELEIAVGELPKVYEAYMVQREWGSNANNLTRYANFIRGLVRDMEQEPAQNILTRRQEFENFRSQKDYVINESTLLLSNFLLEKINSSTSTLADNLELFNSYCSQNISVNESAICNRFNTTPSLLWTRLPPHIERMSLENVTFSSSLETTVTDLQSTCVVFDQNKPCTVHTPVLFLHGHSVLERNAPEYSLQAFASYVTLLEENNEYINAGALTTYDRYSGLPREWFGFPIAVTGTYYYDAYLNGSSYITSIAKSESIDTYAIAVSNLVDTLRSRTGSDKVKIVAFSMGGLVARRYLQLFGENKVEELILIGSPNHGIDSSVARFCPWLGANKECTEMTIGSAMIGKINDPSDRPSIPVTMIYGTGCDTYGSDGDGIVSAASARLDWAQNIAIKGNCSGEYLHTKLINLNYHKQVFNLVEEKLQD